MTDAILPRSIKQLPQIISLRIISLKIDGACTSWYPRLPTIMRHGKILPKDMVGFVQDDFQYLDLIPKILTAFARRK